MLGQEILAKNAQWGGSANATDLARDTYNKQQAQGALTAQQQVRGLGQSQQQVQQLGVTPGWGNVAGAQQQAQGLINNPNISGATSTAQQFMGQQGQANRLAYQQQLSQAQNSNIALARSGTGGAMGVRNALASNQSMAGQAMGSYNAAQAQALAQGYGMQQQANVANAQQRASVYNAQLQAASQQQQMQQQYQLGLLGQQGQLAGLGAQTGLGLSGQYMGGLQNVNNQQLGVDNGVNLYNQQATYQAQKDQAAMLLAGFNAFGGMIGMGAGAKSGGATGV